MCVHTHVYTHGYGYGHKAGLFFGSTSTNPLGDESLKLISGDTPDLAEPDRHQLAFSNVFIECPRFQLENLCDFLDGVDQFYFSHASPSPLASQNSTLIDELAGTRPFGE